MSILTTFTDPTTSKVRGVLTKSYLNAIDIEKYFLDGDESRAEFAHSPVESDTGIYVWLKYRDGLSMLVAPVYATDIHAHNHILEVVFDIE